MLLCFSYLYFMICEQISSRYWRRLNTDGYALLKYVKYLKTTGTSVLLQNHQTGHQVWHPFPTSNSDVAYWCFNIKVILPGASPRVLKAQLMICHFSSSIAASILIATNLFIFSYNNSILFYILSSTGVVFFVFCLLPFLYEMVLCLSTIILWYKGR